MYKLIVILLIFHLSSTTLGQSSEKHVNDHRRLSINTGIGTTYGSSLYPGLGFQWDFFRFSNASISIAPGLSYDEPNDNVLYAGTFRLGFGNKDRLLIDTVYGISEYDIEEAFAENNRIYRKTTKEYGPSLLVGYQRIAGNGFIFSSGFGISSSSLSTFMPTFYISFGIMVL